MAEKVKKICFVQPRAYYLFNPKVNNFSDKIGGAQKQSFLYSIEIAKKSGFDVHFVVADFGQKDKELIEGVIVWKSFSFSDNILKRAFDLFKILKKINADIYIFRSADTGVALAFFYIRYFLKKKVFYMLAGDAEYSFKSLKQKSGIFTAVLMPFVYKKADIISAQSETQAGLLKKYRKISVDLVLKNIVSLPENLNKSEKELILWVGRLDKIKNPELFIELAQKFPDEQFVMIAPVVRDFVKYGNELKNTAKQIKNLQYIDFVIPDKINEYYKRAKIYVMTSFSEGFSNTMAEAMANAVPVLSFKVNPDNIFERYKVGYFANGNKNEFFKLFENLANNNLLSEKLGYNGRIYIEKNHNKNSIIENLFNVLKSV